MTVLFLPKMPSRKWKKKSTSLQTSTNYWNTPKRTGMEKIRLSLWILSGVVSAVAALLLSGATPAGGASASLGSGVTGLPDVDLLPSASPRKLIHLKK